MRPRFYYRLRFSSSIECLADRSQNALRVSIPFLYPANFRKSYRVLPLRSIVTIVVTFADFALYVALPSPRLANDNNWNLKKLVKTNHRRYMITQRRCPRAIAVHRGGRTTGTRGKGRKPGQVRECRFVDANTVLSRFPRNIQQIGNRLHMHAKRRGAGERSARLLRRGSPPPARMSRSAGYSLAASYDGCLMAQLDIHTYRIAAH